MPSTGREVGCKVSKFKVKATTKGLSRDLVAVHRQREAVHSNNLETHNQHKMISELLPVQQVEKRAKIRRKNSSKTGDTMTRLSA
jgi:hypothetical protein